MAENLRRTSNATVSIQPRSSATTYRPSFPVRSCRRRASRVFRPCDSDSTGLGATTTQTGASSSLAASPAASRTSARSVPRSAAGRSGSTKTGPRARAAAIRSTRA
ncbi:hypothetical protein BJF79_24535 [Actinomadura sp. CNU-125]|nr:hypothetical protein BJF79_24535 [Actinomadura sp. CNU-125]